MISVKNYADSIDGTGILESGEKISGFFRNEQMSASLIKAWETCPANAIINQVLQEESEPLLVGSKTHAVLEKCFSEGLSRFEGLQLCTPEKLEVEPSVASKVQAYVEAYFNMKPYNKITDDTEYLTEQYISTEVSPLGVKLPVPLLGFIDRIDIAPNGTFLIDYKTASRAPKEDQYIDQMIIYKWIYEAFFGQPVKGVYVASLYKGNPKYIKQNITLKKESKLVDKIFLVDEEVKRAINNGNKFPKRKG